MELGGQMTGFVVDLARAAQEVEAVVAGPLAGYGEQGEGEYFEADFGRKGEKGWWMAFALCHSYCEILGIQR